MSTEQRTEVLRLIGEWGKFAADYKQGRDEAIYAMAAIQNQLNVLFRETFGFTAFDGKVVEDGKRS